jgi:hypothetical protein
VVADYLIAAGTARQSLQLVRFLGSNLAGVPVCVALVRRTLPLGDVHRVFDETAVERLLVRQLSAALTANSTDAP